MKKYLLISLLLLFGCAHDARLDYVNDRDCDYYGKSFCVSEPHLDHVLITSPAIDFFIYSLQSEDRLLLSVYEGNHSQTYGPEEFTEMIFNGMTVKHRQFDDGEIVHTYYFNEAASFPSEIHIQRPKNLPPNLEEEAIRVEESIRFCVPQGASMIC